MCAREGAPQTSGSLHKALWKNTSSRLYVAHRLKDRFWTYGFNTIFTNSTGLYSTSARLPERSRFPPRQGSWCIGGRCSTEHTRRLPPGHQAGRRGAPGPRSSGPSGGQKVPEGSHRQQEGPGAEPAHTYLSVGHRAHRGRLASCSSQGFTNCQLAEMNTFITTRLKGHICRLLLFLPLNRGGRNRSHSLTHTSGSKANWFNSLFHPHPDIRFGQPG